MSFLFRETNIINSILSSAESWYGVTKQQIEKLEDVDLHYSKKILNGHSKTAKEAFYLETGCIPLRFVMISRQLNFWRHIINSEKNSLLYKFYKIQKYCPVKNDWVNQIELDKMDIGLNLSEEDVSSISKRKFKKIVKEKIKKASLIFLNNLANPHSKSENLVKSELKCSIYLKDKRFSASEAQLLFKLRTRMFSVKDNLKIIT